MVTLTWAPVVSLDHPQRPAQVDPLDVALYGPPSGPRRCGICGVFIGSGSCSRWARIGYYEPEWDHR